MAATFLKGSWSQDERQQLVKLIRQGLKPQEISEQLNRSVKGVKTVMGQMSLQPGFNRALLEGAAKRCLTGKNAKVNQK